MYQIRDKADAVVARLRLPRDAYRLGEVVHALVDFTAASQPTFKVFRAPKDREGLRAR